MSRLTGKTLMVVTLLSFIACSDEQPQSDNQANADTQVVSPSGPIIGFTGQYGDNAYLGIPFAEPPVGPLRWSAPVTAAPWSEPLNATQFGNACPQIGSQLGGATNPDDFGKPIGHEDCLFLDVYTPGQTEELLPVMVWIHGGGNTIGQTGFYNGGNLATTHNVIVVNVQYRLGPFGWFLHPALADSKNPENGSGNYGTLDLIQSLKWVKNNIAAFGGDPDNVTIFGESAGGTNVYSLMLSPLARGLFHKAISQSGSLFTTSAALAQNFVDDNNPGHRSSSSEIITRLLIADGEADDRAAARKKLKAMSNPEITEYLRNKPTWELFNTYIADGGLLGPDNPRVIADGYVLPKGDPLKRLRDVNQYNAVPAILGTNREEMKIFMTFNPDRVTSLFGLPLWVKDSDDYQTRSLFAAKAWKRRGVDDPAMAMAGRSPVYAYRWDWNQEGTAMGFIDLTEILGASHGLEIPFVFGHWNLGELSDILFTEDNLPGRDELSNAMMSYWAQFAYTGNPGRGRNGKLAQWKLWDSAPSGERTLLLNTKDHKGIRMSDILVNRSHIFAELETTEVADDFACEIFVEMFKNEKDKMWLEKTRSGFRDGVCA